MNEHNDYEEELTPSPRIRNLRFALVGVILVTVPFYLIGIVMLFLSGGGPSAASDATEEALVTASPIGGELTETSTLRPTSTISDSPTVESPLGPTPFQFLPPANTRVPTATEQVVIPEDTAAPTLTPRPQNTQPPANTPVPTLAPATATPMPTATTVPPTQPPPATATTVPPTEPPPATATTVPPTEPPPATATTIPQEEIDPGGEAGGGESGGGEAGGDVSASGDETTTETNNEETAP